MLTFPFLVGILAYYFLGEKYSKLDFTCLVISFLGILLIAKPPFFFKYISSFPSQETIKYENRVLGIILALTIALIWAIESIIQRKLKNTTNSFNQLIYFSFGNVIIAPFIHINDSKSNVMEISF